MADSNSAGTSSTRKSVRSPAHSSDTVTQARKNLTQMIITINFLFVVSNMSPILNFLSMEKFGASSITSVVLSIVSNLLLFFTHSSGLFIYLSFDKLFRQTFNSQFGIMNRHIFKN